MKDLSAFVQRVLHGRMIPLGVFLGAFLFQLALQAFFRPYAQEGIYFQMWTSETMMQTVSLADLQAQPWQSLVYLHIQPPALDALRAALAALWPGLHGMELVRQVDQALYGLWALLYAGMAALLYAWLEQAAGRVYALLAALVFMLHPALIFYATLLEATLLTSAAVLWLFYNLWRLHTHPGQSIWPFTLSVVALFFIRSIFQWPVVFLFVISLLLLKAPYRKIVLFLCVAGGVMGVYTLKQWVVLGIPSTTSFTGMSLLKSIERLDAAGYHTYLDGLQEAGPESLNEGLFERFPNPAQVLTRMKKLSDTPNYNHFRYLELDGDLKALYRQELAGMSFSELLQRYALNFRIYLQPSSNYTPHVIVDRLPWRSLYDRLFSYPLLLLLALAALAVSIPAIRRQPHAALAYLLPAGFIVFASIFAESGENMRFKFFLEPVWFCFLAFQGYTLGKLVLRGLRRDKS